MSQVRDPQQHICVETREFSIHIKHKMHSLQWVSVEFNVTNAFNYKAESVQYLLFPDSLKS